MEEKEKTRLIQLEEDLLAENDKVAGINRATFKFHGQLALNLVSSPGSGKTTLLCETCRRLQGSCPVYVIEGDQQTPNDANRIRETGAPALQINTGEGCHLEAEMIQGALTELKPADRSIVFIENVGNLVCPAAYDLGEAHKVVVLSCTEGEDKPIKYPYMFMASDLMLLTKTDLLPYLDFDVDKCVAYARQVNPKIRCICLSSKSGEGFDEWIGWLRDELAAAKA